jgi:hypothetical protein
MPNQDVTPSTPNAWDAYRRRFRALRVAEACERAAGNREAPSTPDSEQALIEDLYSALGWLIRLHSAPGIEYGVRDLVDAQREGIFLGGADDLRAIAAEWRRFAELPAQSDPEAP